MRPHSLIGRLLLLLLDLTDSLVFYSKTKAFFDPDANAFCAREGFVDISPAADGGVLKKVLREGKEGGRWVEEGCPTFGG